MKIDEAFGLKRGTITSVVGGGGKTTLIGALAASLAGRGLRVVTTTTTRAYLPGSGEAGKIVRSEGDLPSALSETSPVALVPLPEGVAKGPGLSPESVERILRSGVADHILVEADGSRGRPFKCYRSDEPVVPPGTATVIAVFGTDLLGEVMGPGNCLRAEKLPGIGLEAGRVCGEEEGGVLLGALLGILRDLGPYQRVIPFLNKVEEGRAVPARALAERVLRMEEPGVSRVILGSLRTGLFQEVSPGGR